MNLGVGSLLDPTSKYDEDWEEYIDLDEHAVLGQKEKLKVVLISPSPTVN